MGTGDWGNNQMLDWLESEGLARAAVLLNEEYIVIEKINSDLVAHFVSAGEGMMYKLSGESESTATEFTINVSDLLDIAVESSDSKELFTGQGVEFNAGSYAGAPLYRFEF